MSIGLWINAIVVTPLLASASVYLYMRLKALEDRYERNRDADARFMHKFEDRMQAVEHRLTLIDQVVRNGRQIAPVQPQ